jgi:hypothetical protein
VVPVQNSHLFRLKTAGGSDPNRPPCRSEATLVF